jgi:flagellar secretion chaperone FliS
MHAYTSPRASAYQNTAAHGSVAAADPHGLILLLMDGALQRIARAKGCIQNKSYSEKAQLIHHSVRIIDELRNSLNLEAGGEISRNLDDLYDYMCRQLLRASVENKTSFLDEVTRLLQNIRDAWAQIPKNAANARPKVV